MDEPNMNDRAEAALTERKLLGVTDEEWSHAMGLACEMAANGSKLGASIIVIKAIREAVKQERERWEAAMGVRLDEPLLLQDENSGRDGRRYNEWHASRPDAPLNAREAAAAIRSRSVVKDGLTPREVQG